MKSPQHTRTAYLSRSKPRPWDPLLFAVAGLILVSVARLHVFIPGAAAIRPGLLLSVCAVAMFATSYRGARRIEHLKSPLAYLMIFFVGWAVVGAPFALYAGKAVMFLLDHFLREAIVIFLMVAAIRDHQDLKRLLAVFGFGVIAFAVLGTGGGASRSSVGAGGYDPNDSAMFVVSGIPLIFFFLLRTRKIAGKIMFGLGLVACSSLVITSGSRGGFLGMVAVLVYCLFFLKGIKPFARVVVVGLVAVVISYQGTSEFWDRVESITDESDYNYQSYTGRKQIWLRGLEYIGDNPLLGVGIANFTVAEGQHPDTRAMLEQGRGVKFSAAHSLWVQTAAETGLPGFAALIGMFLVAFRVNWDLDRRARRFAREAPELEELARLARPLMGVLIGVAVAGTFLSRAYSSLVWMPLGLTLAVIKVRGLKMRELARAAHARHQRTPEPRRSLRPSPTPTRAGAGDHVWGGDAPALPSGGGS